MTGNASVLESRAEAFASDITHTVRRILEGTFEPFVAQIGEGRVVVKQPDQKGLPLVLVEGAELRLRVTYHCTLDGSGEFLKVVSSQFSVHYGASSEPLVRYEYVSDIHSRHTPTAHLQLHGNNELYAALSMSGRNSKRGERTQRRIAKGAYPGSQNVHFPLGGPRFRPCLEDVLEVLIDQFGVKAADGWETAVAAGRKTWRLRQTAAAVRDAPVVAADALSQLGYTVSPPKEGHPDCREDHLQSL